jgi:hypothetical protein
MSSTTTSTSNTPAAPAKPGQYDIGKPHGVCAVTNESIPPGTKFIAALRETPAGFERLDISRSAWETFDRKNLLAFWQAVMPEPHKKQKMFVDDNVLCELFERLSDVDEPAKVSFRFVLGLILMRKRLLTYDTTRTEAGREIWRVKMKGREQPLEMVDPKLSEDQLGDVTQQLGQILNSEL